MYLMLDKMIGGLSQATNYMEAANIKGMIEKLKENNDSEEDITTLNNYFNWMEENKQIVITMYNPSFDFNDKKTTLMLSIITKKLKIFNEKIKPKLDKYINELSNKEQNSNIAEITLKRALKQKIKMLEDVNKDLETTNLRNIMQSIKVNELKEEFEILSETMEIVAHWRALSIYIIKNKKHSLEILKENKMKELIENINNMLNRYNEFIKPNLDKYRKIGII